MSSIEASGSGSLPRPALWGAMVLIVVVLCFGLAELILRIIPGEWWNTNRFSNVFDPDTGDWHAASYVGDYANTDYTVRGIHYNAFGMRDRERSLEKEPGVFRIAVLGDSFVEGLQVADDQTFTRKMEAELGQKVEVLNFGVGGFGTLQEKIAYEKKVRPFKPDLVILGFLSGNDMRNNSEELETLAVGGRSQAPFIVRQPDGSWRFDPPVRLTSADDSVSLFMQKHSALYRFALLTARRLMLHNWFGPKTTAASATGTPSTDKPRENVSVYLTRLFAPPEGQAQVFKDAWAATDKILSELDREVAADGAKFMVVTEPRGAEMYPDARAALEKEYGQPLPAEFDIDYPERHLGELAAKEGFMYLNLTPAFRAYRDANDLQPPYFSFAHDGHWRPFGHELAAETIDAELARLKLLPAL